MHIKFKFTADCGVGGGQQGYVEEVPTVELLLEQSFEVIVWQSETAAVGVGCVRGFRMGSGPERLSQFIVSKIPKIEFKKPEIECN